jgi:hypothetical protein
MTASFSECNCARNVTTRGGGPRASRSPSSSTLAPGSAKWTVAALIWNDSSSGHRLFLRWDEASVRYLVVTKTKNLAVQEEPLLRGPLAEDNFLWTAIGVHRAIDAGVAYPVRGWQADRARFERFARRSEAVPEIKLAGALPMPDPPSGMRRTNHASGTSRYPHTFPHHGQCARCRSASRSSMPWLRE